MTAPYRPRSKVELKDLEAEYTRRLRETVDGHNDQQGLLAGCHTNYITVSVRPNTPPTPRGVHRCPAVCRVPVRGGGMVFVDRLCDSLLLLIVTGPVVDPRHHNVQDDLARRVARLRYQLPATKEMAYR